MKKTLILMAAAASFMLTGCTENDLLGDASFASGSSGAIEFSAKTRDAGVTRAYTTGAMTTDVLKDAGFGVFAYYTGATDFASWTHAAPNFMYNESITWTGSSGTPANVWTYSPVKYWPNGTDAANAENTPSNSATQSEVGKVSFFAYAPYKAASTTAYDPEDTNAGGVLPTGVTSAVWTGSGAPTGVANGIVAITKNDETKAAQVKYILSSAAEKDAVDLLWGLRGSASYSEADNTASTGTVGTGYNTDLTKQIVPEKVSFLMKHALAQVGGSTSTTTSAGTSQRCGLKVVVDVDANSDEVATGKDNQSAYLGSAFSNQKTLVTIKSVSIKDNYTYNHEKDASTSEKSDFVTDGWFNIETGTWSGQATVPTHTTNSKGVIYNIEAKSNPGTGEYGLNKDIAEPTEAITKPGDSWSIDGVSGVTTSAKNVYKDQDIPGLLLIPGTSGNNTLYVTVNYVVRTADTKLNQGYTEVEQTITNKVSIANSLLASNKFLTLVMHLGLTSVKFEAVVSDWENTTDATNNENGSVTEGTTANENSVWLPSNVVSSTASTPTTAQVGDIYYSDGTWSTTLEAGKTPIGIIAHVGNDEYTESGNGGGHGLVLALNNAASGNTLEWASTYTDLNMTKITTDAQVTAAGNISGYDNTEYITGKGDEAAFPAAYAAVNYTPAAPTGTTGWFLPSPGQWYKILQNLGGVTTTSPLFWTSSGGAPHMGAISDVATALNTSLSVAGAGSYNEFSTTDESHFWTSSEYDTMGSAVALHFDNYGVYFNHGIKTTASDVVRPVLAF